MKKHKKKIIIASIALVIVIIIVFLGTSQKISDIKNDEHLGEKVKISGIVTNVVKFGNLSGYELMDKSGDKISVAAKKLPMEGDKMIAKGILMKEIFIGYYILTDQ